MVDEIYYVNILIQSICSACDISEYTNVNYIEIPNIVRIHAQLIRNDINHIHHCNMQYNTPPDKYTIYSDIHNIIKKIINQDNAIIKNGFCELCIILTKNDLSNITIRCRLCQIITKLKKPTYEIKQFFQKYYKTNIPSTLDGSVIHDPLAYSDNLATIAYLYTLFNNDKYMLHKLNNDLTCIYNLLLNDCELMINNIYECVNACIHANIINKCSIELTNITNKYNLDVLSSMLLIGDHTYNDKISDILADSLDIDCTYNNMNIYKQYIRLLYLITINTLSIKDYKKYVKLAYVKCMIIYAQITSSVDTNILAMLFETLCMLLKMINTAKIYSCIFYVFTLLSHRYSDGLYFSLNDTVNIHNVINIHNGISYLMQ
jgi:hypothetical protein